VLHIYPAIKKRFGGNSGFITLGPVFEISDVQATAGRFITSKENGLGDDILKLSISAARSLCLISTASTTFSNRIQVSVFTPV
jgi:hypothetical protein